MIEGHQLYKLTDKFEWIEVRKLGAGELLCEELILSKKKDRICSYKVQVDSDEIEYNFIEFDKIEKTLYPYNLHNLVFRDNCAAKRDFINQ
jgi:hypothetical protein